MTEIKAAKARQLKKNEALNAIRKIYNPKYEFPYDKGHYWGDMDDVESRSEQRESRIAQIIRQLEDDLSILKVSNLTTK